MSKIVNDYIRNIHDGEYVVNVLINQRGFDSEIEEKFEDVKQLFKKYGYSESVEGEYINSTFEKDKMKYHFITKSIVEGHTDKYYVEHKNLYIVNNYNEAETFFNELMKFVELSETKLYKYPCLVFGSNGYSVEDGNINHLDYMYNLHHDQIKRENFHEYLGYYETEFDAEIRCKKENDRLRDNLREEIEVLEKQYNWLEKEIKG